MGGGGVGGSKIEAPQDTSGESTIEIFRVYPWGSSYFLFTPANSPAKDSRFKKKKILSAPLCKNSPSGSGSREHKIETET